MNIAANIDRLMHEINAACASTGRDPEQVRLLAVSKTRGIDDVRSAFAAGQLHLGENYLQEAVGKIEALPEACWHFIGAIQSNKTRDIARYFTWIHSVESFKVARRLSEQRTPALGPLNLLIQVNVSGEATKAGIPPDAVSQLVEKSLNLDGVRLRGLMTIPRANDDASSTRRHFQCLRELRDEVASRHGIEEFNQLSMGMSADYRLAISEGATWLRLGTAVFGPRASSPTNAIDSG